MKTFALLAATLLMQIMTTHAQSIHKITVKDIDPEQVSEVLRMSYEQNLPNRDIGRRLDLRHHTVGKILDASAQVLRDEPLAKVS